ncbi:MAG: hypothetical protein LBT47_02215 [Deltaproteobacteria bacterium]|jgi:hypothetical protein|nr:hypothetical protein [Deltaproteobacteria bacterium]
MFPSEILHHCLGLASTHLHFDLLLKNIDHFDVTITGDDVSVQAESQPEHSQQVRDVPINLGNRRQVSQKEDSHQSSGQLDRNNGGTRTEKKNYLRILESRPQAFKVKGAVPWFSPPWYLM